MTMATKETQNKEVDFAGITFTGATAHFLLRQQEGYKLMVNPLSQSYVDEIYSQVDARNICLLSIVNGTSGHHFNESLFTDKFEKNFSHSNVKNGVLFDVKSSIPVTSVCDFLKYLPNKDIEENVHSESIKKQEFSHKLLNWKETFIRKWTLYYHFEPKSVSYSPHEMNVNSHEHIDRSEFLKVITAFYAPLTMIIEEASINVSTKLTPHGILDISVMSSKSSDSLESLNSTTTCIGVLLLDKIPAEVIFASSLKTEASIAKRGSERQAVLELLTLSECSGGHSLCVLLLADRKEYSAYFYYPPEDLLLKMNSLVYKGEEGIGGCFVLNMILDHSWTFCHERFIDFALEYKKKYEQESKCGWRAAVDCSPNKHLFSGELLIQRNPQPKKRIERSFSSLPGLAAKMLQKRHQFLDEL